MTRFKNRRRGFTLWELLIVLMLLGAVSVLMTRLFGSSVRVFVDAPAARDEIGRYQAMIESLRADVWNAREMKIEESSCGITQGNGATPRWKINEADATIEITRVLGDEHRSWRFSSFNRISFSSRDAELILSVSSAEHGDDKIAMTSELLSLTRAKESK